MSGLGRPESAENGRNPIPDATVNATVLIRNVNGKSETEVQGAFYPAALAGEALAAATAEHRAALRHLRVALRDELD